MKKIFNSVFPFFDHLYIFQLLEYDILDFLQWFLKHPSKRNLQRKNKLTLTPKALAILTTALGLIVLTSAYTSYNLIREIYLTPFLIFFYALFSPIFIILAQALILPLEIYSEIKIKSLTKEKLKKLPGLKIIAIVGSFAKTSTKNILYTLLWKDFKVVKTPKSFNTEVSVARTVISDIKDNTEVFIVEMDAYHKGEIKDLCVLVNPKYGVITAIAAQHLERFNSMEELAKTQFELADALNNGILFLNSTDEWSMKLEKDWNDLEKVFYGQRKEDNIYYSDAKPYEKGWMFKLHFPSSSRSGSSRSGDLKKVTASSSNPRNDATNDATQVVEVELPLFGAHNIINFLAAASIALKLGLPLKTIQDRASLIQPTEHRLEIKKLGSITLIDNSYNTNPTVSKSSLNLLKEYKDSQKILITPGLIELGDEQAKENQDFAKNAASVADIIIIVGKNAQKDLLKGLKQANFAKEKTHIVKNTQGALELLASTAKPQAVVLLENDLPDQYF